MGQVFGRQLLLGISALSFATAAAAQDTPRQPVGNQAPNSGLEEIVVTARRQAENLQATPVSVSALSANTIERLNIQDINRVAQLTPNVTLSQSSGTVSGVAAFIRGIGNQDPLLSLDTPIGIYLDGVYTGRVGAAGSFDLVDLERIEVLRGPQGTLFGRNTTGGAISLITRQPLDEARVQAKAGYGSFNEWYTRISADTGEIGASGLKATVAYLHRERDGIVNNVVAPKSRDPGAINNDAVWLKVTGDWGPLRAALTADYNDRRGVPLNFQIAALTPEAAAYYGRSPGLGGDTLAVVRGDRVTRNRQEIHPGQHARIWGSALTLEYEFSRAFQLKSITSYREFKSSQATRYAEPNLLGEVITSFAPFATGVARVTPFSAPQHVDQDQVSEEFQVLGSTDTFKYVAGLYYFRETYRENNPNFFTVLPPFTGSATAGLNLNPVLDYNGSATSYAAFGQASYTPPILDKRMELTLGIRRTRDKKRISVRNFQFPGDPAPALAVGARNFNNTSYNATINFQWTDDVMTYARFGTGYRSGGFNARGGGQTFLPEEATTYEVGLKSEFFDRRLRFNAASFFTKYKDLQVAQFSQGQGFAENANAEYPGFEIEVQAAPVTGLTLDGSVGYVRPKYTAFPQLDPANPAQLIDIKKIARFPYVPKVTTHVGVEYAFQPISVGQFLIRVDYSTSSTRYFHASNLPNLNPLNDLIRDPGQKNLTARATLANVALGGGVAEISLWGENLTNHDNIVAGIDFGPALGFAGVNYGLPRRLGVDLKFTY